MKKFLFLIILIITCEVQAQEQGKIIMSNPLNLSYRFQTDGVCRREAADPVIILFKDQYYLFASHSSGYWHSSNLRDWDYIETKTLKAAEVSALAVFVYKGAIYYLGMGESRIYKSTNPEADEWEEVKYELRGLGDPAFFQDNDGRVYLYYGCSDNEPIRGFEVDPENSFRAISPEVDLIPHSSDRLGWEVFGEKNEQYDKKGWNEAPCITRQGDYYYLMYATPGTEFTSYCTGVYTARNPLGPYTCMPGAPFAIKPGGFITGAGHGHPFKDRYGNNWYVGTMIVSAKEHFERRIGIFPAYYQDGYAPEITDYTDFPFILPEKKVDFSRYNISADMNLLSYGKKMKASSSLESHTAAMAADENIKTWWSAASGKIGEWLEMDLGTPMELSAIQVSFADESFQTYRRDKVIPIYQYIIEASLDGIKWKTIVDRSQNTKDQIYELVLLDKVIKTRFVRIKNKKEFAVGNFSIADMRLFGKAKGKTPQIVTGLNINRGKDRRRIAFSWTKQPVADGYIIRWGISPEHIDNAVMVRGSQAEFGFFDCNISYYITIEAFNESGKGKQSNPIKID